MTYITIEHADGTKQRIAAQQFILIASTDDDIPSSPTEFVATCNRLFVNRAQDKLSAWVIENRKEGKKRGDYHEKI